MADLKKAGAILRGFVWLILRPGVLWNKRSQVKQRLARRFYADDEWLGEVTKQRGIRLVFRKSTKLCKG